MVSLVIVPSSSQNTQAVFSVNSNSTVSDLAFNSTSQQLSFTVSGPSGTTGYCDVYISKTVISDASNVKAYIDGNEMNYTVTSTGDSWMLQFTYHHSTHMIVLNLKQASSGFSSGIFQVMLATGAVAAIVTATVALRIYYINNGVRKYSGKRAVSLRSKLIARNLTQ